MPNPTLILSDLHLGRGRRSGIPAVEGLRPLWEGARRLVLNGDVAEVHHPTRRAEAARLAVRLLDLCEADGVEVTILSGNHDPFISDLRHLPLAGGEVFVTHGDVLHPAVAPWSPAGARIRKTHEAALAAIEPARRDDLEARLEASQFASYAEWAVRARLENEAGHSTVLGMLVRPWSIVQVVHYWWTIPRLAADFAARHAPLARFVVIGHTHRPGVWRVGERVIINTGSFGFPGRPWAVVVEDGALHFRPVVRRGETFALGGEELGESFELRAEGIPPRAEEARQVDHGRDEEDTSGEDGVRAPVTSAE